MAESTLTDEQMLDIAMLLELDEDDLDLLRDYMAKQDYNAKAEAE